MEEIKITIDGKAITAKKGQTITEAARENGVFIPVLCDYKGLKPAGTCRICTVLVGGRPMAACTTKVTDGMEIINESADLNEMRLNIIEMLFVEGNHFCPSCEKSGECELQALGYKYQMLAPKFPYLFKNKGTNADNAKLYLDGNRCILCKRCVRGVTDASNRPIFAIQNRGYEIAITIADEMKDSITDEIAEKAMAICPVGAILRKEKGYAKPIGTRKYDKTPIDIAS